MQAQVLQGVSVFGTDTAATGYVRVHYLSRLKAAR